MDISNDLIFFNKKRLKKDLYTNNTFGDDVEYSELYSREEEANHVVRKIKDLCSTEKYNYHDIVVLYRNSSQSNTIEYSLMQVGIPYILVGGFKFYNRKEVKDVINYVSYLIQKDDFSFLNIINLPSRGIGPKALEKIANIAKLKTISFWEAFLEIYDNSKSEEIQKFIEVIKKYQKINLQETIISDIALELVNDIGLIKYYTSLEDNERVNNVNSFFDQMKTFEMKNKIENNRVETIINFINFIKLSSSSDEVVQKNKLTLMTIHASKGTEAKIVFLIGFNQGILPDRRAITSGEIEEERRLVYVAFTRAEEKLYISCSLGYDWWGNQMEHSKFLDEIEAKINYGVLDKNKNYYSDNTNFDFLVGDVIQHTIFGEGVIIAEYSDELEIAFNNNYGIKLLKKNHKSILKV